MSLGSFYRASVRRALDLPPAWQARRRAPAPQETTDRSSQTADPGGGREARAPAGTSGVRSVAGGSTTPANARERQTDPRPQPPRPPDMPPSCPPSPPVPPPPRVARIVPSERIDLRQAPSAMERIAQAGEAAQIRAVKCSDQVPDRVPCKCGAREGGRNWGFVPAWFGRGCIEADCPLRGLGPLREVA